ncbi:MAG: hypothetical protein ACTTJS_01000 [Wolinella sp.]
MQDFNFDKTHAHASFSIKHMMVSLPHRGVTKTVVFDTEIEVSARDMRGEQRICVELSGEISCRRLD